MTLFGIPMSQMAILLLIGFLPSEIWRLISALAARGIDEKSEVFEWVRCVANVLLASIVAKIMFAPSGELALIPFAFRVGSIGLGALAFLVFKRSVFAAVFLGEVGIIASGYWFAGS